MNPASCHWPQYHTQCNSSWPFSERVCESSVNFQQYGFDAIQAWTLFMQEKIISLIASGCCETTCMNVVSQAQSHSTKLCRLFLSAYNIGRKLTQKGLQCVFRNLSFSEPFSYSATIASCAVRFYVPPLREVWQHVQWMCSQVRYGMQSYTTGVFFPNGGQKLSC